ncbi:tyrosine-type recombinase/integrase [Trinickia symbiotica]|uniref:tyrosine-type recombinase/integrase n=1 Tax=Trinickia symbiotica TaxID=863227 RepID=UPI001304AFBC|nr:site-specific integrase [Trinickia symbiotica]
MAGKASDRRFRFTKARLDALPLPPAGKRAVWHDERRPELALRVTGSGVKSFYVIQRAKGKLYWFKLGTYPTMTIEQAQAAATKLLSAVADGVDPMQAKRALRGEPTLDEFFTEYWERHAQFKDSGRDDKQRYATHIKPRLGGRKLSQVTEEDAKAIAEGMERAGLSGATINRVKALLHILFQKAAVWKVCIRPNPADAIERRGEKSRKRFLRGNEIPAFFAALAELPVQPRNFFSLCLLLGQRRENTLSMKWSDVDFVEKVWRIPDTKNGEPHEVPLTSDALEILEAMRELRSDSPFVFPGAGAKGHLTEPKRQWRKLLQAAGIEDLHIHDLRRTLGSWQAKSGVSLAMIGKTLGHKTLQTTLVYARLDSDPVRQAMQTATDAMKVAAGMAGPEPSAD